MENTQITSIPAPRYELSVARWALWVSAFLVFMVVVTGKVRYTEGDSRYSLLATTALIEHGNLRLDPYVHELDLDKLNNGHTWMIFRSGESSHFYYDYPVGTPIFSLPYVWLARQFGMSPILREDDTAMQIGLTALLCVAVFLLLYRLANLYLGEWAALLFSLALFFGTTLTSTMGSALWSHDFQTLFTLLVVLELAEWERGKRPRLRGAWLGFLLFAAYLCRPTSAALIVAVFGYVAWRQRRSLPLVMGVSGGLFLLFVLWSWLELHMVLPRYYDPTLWQPGKGFWEHLLPLWFGPARGLWAFTPVFFLVFATWGFRRMRLQPLHLMVWVWLLLHTYLLMRSQSPWAGWSFGPRFFTELIPGLAVVLLMIAGELPEMSPRLRNGLATAFVILSGFGIYVHTFQGLNNPETQAWNDNPNIDRNWAQRRWDWRHPQFFASATQRAALAMEVALDLQIQQLGKRIPNDANLYYGPSDPTVRACFQRWTADNHFGKRQKLFNSVYSLQSAGVTEFYFSSAQVKEIKAIPGVQIDSSKADRMCLGDFLKLNAENEILIAGKDDATTGPDPKTRTYFRSIGSLLDSVKLRESYIAHIKGGKLLHEEWSPNKIVYESTGSKPVFLQSAGLFAGNFASIVVAGKECSLNQRGMNVVVLDETRNLLWITSFDTHADDRERVVMWTAKVPPAPVQ